ncbi:MAG: NHL repeat-containing protein, partial [Leptospirillum sp.]
PLAMTQNPATQTIWIAEKGFLDIFDNQGRLLHRIAGITANALAADDSGRVWASIGKDSLVLEIDPENNIIGNFKRTAGISHPGSLAIDSEGTVWIGNHDPDSLTGLSPDGNPRNNSPVSGGGVSDPRAIAVDGENTLWVVNAKGGSLSAFAQDQTPLSPEEGFRGREILNPKALQIDGSGNLWVENHPSPESGKQGFITLVAGAANPQITPLALAPK